jgi:hypothetical protein
MIQPNDAHSQLVKVMTSLSEAIKSTIEEKDTKTTCQLLSLLFSSFTRKEINSYLSPYSVSSDM